MVMKKIKQILADERGFFVSIELIGLSVVALIIAALIYNAVMPETKSLHSKMIDRVKDVTSTGF
jgi:hypothetical protein